MADPDPYGGSSITGNWPPAQPFSGAPDWMTTATATPDTGAPDAGPSIETQRADIESEERGLIEREKTEVAQPLEDALLDTMRQRRAMMDKQIPTPEMPYLFNVQPPPPQNFADPMKAFASPLVFLTLLSSAFSRGRGRAAMDAMTAAINDYHKGDEQALTLQLNNWKNSTDAVIKQNGIEMSRYNAAWRETEHDVGERQARISALAAETGDQQILAAVRSGNFQALHKMLDDRKKQLDKLEQERLRWFGPEGGGAAPVDDAAAETYFQTGKLPPNIGRGVQGAAESKRIRARAQELHPDVPPATWPRRWQLFATQASGMRVLETRAAGLKLAEEEASGLLPRVEALIDKVSPTRFRDLNSLINAARARTGGEDVIRLGVAIESLIPVYARVLKPVGQVGVEDMKRAHSILDMAWSRGQMRAALSQMRLELESAKQALGRARKTFLDTGEEPTEQSLMPGTGSSGGVSGVGGWSSKPIE